MALTLDNPLATLGQTSAPTGLSGAALPAWLVPQPLVLLGQGQTGLTAVRAQNNPPAPAQANAPATLKEPAMGATSKFPQAVQGQIQKLDRTPVRLDLFDAANNNLPKPEEVVQGYLGSCSLAATLMALANTPTGRTKIAGM